MGSRDREFAVLKPSRSAGCLKASLACNKLLHKKSRKGKTNKSNVFQTLNKISKPQVIGSKRAIQTIQATLQAQQKKIKRASSCSIDDGSTVFSSSQASTSTVLFGESHSQLSLSPSQPSPPSSATPMFNTDLAESMHYLQIVQRKENSPEHYVRPDYLNEVQQGRIQDQQRTLVIQWLWHIANNEDLHDQTLHLAVRYLERILSLVQVEKQELGHIAVTCLFLAAKYEEVFPPSAKRFVEQLKGTFTIEQLLEKERDILIELKSLSSPTSRDALGTFEPLIKKLVPDYRQQQSVMETSLMLINNVGLWESKLMGVVPSVVAAGAVAVAMKEFNLDFEWVQMLQSYTSLAQEQVYQCRDVLSTAKFQSQ